MKKKGYIEQEFFFSGVAAGQRYTSRMLVRRPDRAADFSGNVVTEWTNVSNGFDLDCLWSRSADHLMRQGDAYVAVDAQFVGVHQPETGLKAFDAVRYNDLNIPRTGTFVAEAGSYDIFAQALKAIKEPEGTRPLGQLNPQHQIVTGCSQSAATVSIYAATAGAAQGLTDAFLISSLSSETIDLTPTGVVFPAPTATALQIPVLQLNTENDEGPVRLQPDGRYYRLWEVAGSTHADLTSQRYTEAIAQRDLGRQLRPYGCEKPPLSRIPFSNVQNAALSALTSWIEDGRAPASLPQIRYEAGEIMRDRHGNALGGIRLPEHAVPTATNDSVNAGNTVCSQLLGSHRPFSRSLLRQLYPTHSAYVRKFVAAARAAVRDGYLLPVDARRSIKLARSAKIPHEQETGGK